MAQIRTIADIEALEAIPLADRKLPGNIYEFPGSRLFWVTPRDSVE